VTRPQIQFCTSADGTRLAIATMSQRTNPPLLMVPSMGSDPGSRYWEDFWAELAPRRFVVTFDRRGFGASQRDIERLDLETEIADIAAVADHLGLASFDLWGVQEGAGLAAAFTATSPGRVSRLILFGGFASGPQIARPGAVEGFNSLVTTNWRFARKAIADMLLPSGTAEEKDEIVESLKNSMSSEMAARGFEFYWHLDVSEYLEKIQTPTLVLHRRGDVLVPVSAARSLASLIADARLVELDGDASMCHQNFPQYIDTVWEFLGEAPSGDHAGPVAPSAFRTVLFTDIVGHTEMMSRLGDERGRDVLREHERIVRDALAEHSGTEVKTMGDGFMASFGSVTKAVECAIALQRAFAERESDEPLNVRVGINAGEPIEEDGDLFGATVILASRIAAKAEGGEILVADTVRGLCSGKGFLFADRGEFVAKGFEDPVRVYEVRWREE